jgi:hypothetical protein
VVFCRTDRISRLEETPPRPWRALASLVQGSRPTTGIVVHGAGCFLKTVELTPKYPAIERMTADLVSLATGQCRRVPQYTPHAWAATRSSK